MSEPIHTAGMNITPHPTEITAEKRAAMQAAKKLSIAQVHTKYAIQNMLDAGTFNPIAMARRFYRLEERTRRTVLEEMAKVNEGKELVRIVERITETAEQFSRKNPELQTRSLLYLRESIKEGDSAEEILRKVSQMYPDVSLTDEALDFLLETTEGPLHEQVLLAKEELNTRYGKEIRAGKNIAVEARLFARQGLGPPTHLRGYYRDIIGNPRDAYALFEELTSQFPYDKLKIFIDFLLHSLGSDLKSKGPSIDPGELYRLLTETRVLQSFLGIFRFFLSRMSLISMSFTRAQLGLPKKLTFEQLAKLFVKLLGERYLSADKVLSLAEFLELEEELLGQVIVFTQMRDAVRQVAPRLYKSKRQREDLLNAFIEAIESLDEKLEEE